MSPVSDLKRNPERAAPLRASLDSTLNDDELLNFREEHRDEIDIDFDAEFGLDDEVFDESDLEGKSSSDSLNVVPEPSALPRQFPTPQRRRRRKQNDDQLPARIKPSELLVADELSRYLHEVRRYPLLDREEERVLAERYYEDDDRESAKRLVTGNLRLVVKIAQQYRRAWVNVMDLIQEGNIGLGEAVKRFDPYRGVRFSSFARYWIRALILQFILKNFRLISFANTRAGRKLFFRLEKERTRLMQLYGEATTQQLALALEVSEEDVEAATLLSQPMLSLDAPRYQSEQESETWGSSIQDEGPALDLHYAEADYQAIISAHMRRFGETIEQEREQVIW
jgi:RNA polymerase sigma-32 factor